MQYILAYKAKSQMEKIRQSMVTYALNYSVKEASDTFECHRNTVSKWVNRYKKYGNEGLKDFSRAPKNIPHKIVDESIVKEICKYRDKKEYGSYRLKKQYNLTPSNMAIHRILVDNNKIKTKVKKHKHRKDLWYIKKTFKTLETKLQLDGKILTDIPHYFKQYKILGLPKWQFTLRDVKSGITYISYMSTEDGVRACSFIVYVFEHFIRHGIDVSKITIQVDGASFAVNLKGLNKTMFQTLVEDIYKAKLKIVPGGKTKQSDVETFHRLIEDEFYKRETFSSVNNFYAKAYKYIYEFNYIRLNSHKDWHTPLYFLKQDRPEISPEILDLPPIWLDAHENMYFFKKNPKDISPEELLILDIPPEKLPCKDYSPNEYLHSFMNRVLKCYNYNLPYAHDVPIYPT